MAGEDRRHMVTLMTGKMDFLILKLKFKCLGPVLERIRMAQEDARLQQNDVQNIANDQNW